MPQNIVLKIEGDKFFLDELKNIAKIEGGNSFLDELKNVAKTYNQTDVVNLIERSESPVAETAKNLKTKGYPKPGRF